MIKKEEITPGAYDIVIEENELATASDYLRDKFDEIKFADEEEKAITKLFLEKYLPTNKK